MCWFMPVAEAFTTHQWRPEIMTIERSLRLIAGSFVLVTILLGHFHHPAWLLFTGFVALNLVQSAFTNWCPMMSILKIAGVPGCELKGGGVAGIGIDQKA
jgi:hypothetical protein